MKTQVQNFFLVIFEMFIANPAVIDILLVLEGYFWQIDGFVSG